MKQHGNNINYKNKINTCNKNRKEKTKKPNYKFYTIYSA